MLIISEASLARRLQQREKLSLDEQKNLDRNMLDAARLGYRRDLSDYLNAGARPDACDESGANGLVLTNQPGCALTLLEARVIDPRRFAVEKMENLILDHIDRGNAKVASILTEFMTYKMCEPITEAFAKAAIDTAYRGNWRYVDTEQWVQHTFGAPKPGG